jgi:hypothetical protein
LKVARPYPGGSLRRAARIRAFTRSDLLVTIAALSVLAALVVLPLNSARRKARLRVCFNNLQQVGRAVLLFAQDHGSALPGLSPTEQQASPWWGYKEEVKHYIGLSGASSPNDLLFGCPVDRGYSDPQPFRQNPRFNFSSYVFNGVTLFGTPNIAGWKVGAVKQPQRTLLVMEWSAHAPLSWHRSRTGKRNAPFYSDAENVVTFVDGHVNLTKIYYDGYNAAYTRDPIPGYEYRFSGQ